MALATSASTNPRRRRTATLVLLALAAWYAPLVTVPLVEPDEGRYAEIPREMLASGDFVTPRLDGLLYFEKPPLHYWLTAASMAVFGRNEFGARCASATLALVTCALTAWLAAAMGSPRRGVLAAAVLALTPYLASIGHLNIIDVTVTCFMTLTMVAFWLAHDAPTRSRRWLAWYGVFGGAALAVLSKGLIGVALPGAVFFLYLLLTRRWAALRKVPWVTGSALFAAVAVPWHALVIARNPSFAYFYFIHEHVLRFATGSAKRGAPVWFLLAVLLVGLLPFTAALGGLRRARGAAPWRDLPRQRPEIVYLLVWAGFILVFFSASHSKLGTYVLPSAPALAALLARVLERRPEAGAGSALERIAGVVAAAFSLAIGVTAAAVTFGLGPFPAGSTAVRLATVLLCVAVAAGTVVWLRAWWAGPTSRATAAMLVAATAVSATLWAGLVAAAPHRSSRDAARTLSGRLADGDLVFCLGDYFQTLPFYLDRQVGVVGAPSDLLFGISQASAAERQDRVVDLAGLRRLWDGDRRVWVVADTRRYRRLPPLPHATEVAATADRLVLCNRSVR